MSQYQSWQSENWYYIGDNLTPIPRTTDYIEYDVNKIYSLFIVDGIHIPYPSTSVIQEYDLAKVYTGWYFNQPESNYLITPFNTPSVLGAFAYSNIQDLNVPVSVSKLGEFSFLKSNLMHIKIAPDCQYYDTTFPEGVEIEYWDVIGINVLHNPSKTSYYLNETEDYSGLEFEATMRDGETTVTRLIRNGYTLSGLDTSVVGDYTVYLTFNNYTVPLSPTFTVSS